MMRWRTVQITAAVSEQTVVSCASMIVVNAASDDSTSQRKILVSGKPVISGIQVRE